MELGHSFLRDNVVRRDETTQGQQNAANFFGQTALIGAADIDTLVMGSTLRLANLTTTEWGWIRPTSILRTKRVTIST